MARHSKRRLVREELAGVDLGDPRREARALAIADRLVSPPESTLPEAMGDRAMLEALYRHLSALRAAAEMLPSRALISASTYSFSNRRSACSFAAA